MQTQELTELFEKTFPFWKNMSDEDNFHTEEPSDSACPDGC